MAPDEIRKSKRLAKSADYLSLIARRLVLELEVALGIGVGYLYWMFDVDVETGY